MTTGAAVLRDWLGEGGVPVPAEQANDRAAICATAHQDTPDQRCPQNGKGDWTAWFTMPAQRMIQAQLNMRNDLQMKTPHDDRLVVCEACGCPLKLKVHVPIKHIRAHLTDEVRLKLHPKCWILKEEKA